MKEVVFVVGLPHLSPAGRRSCPRVRKPVLELRCENPGFTLEEAVRSIVVGVMIGAGLGRVACGERV
jgi:hypothetical protein